MPLAIAYSFQSFFSTFLLHHTARRAISPTDMKRSFWLVLSSIDTNTIFIGEAIKYSSTSLFNLYLCCVEFSSCCGTSFSSS
ncbi:ORF1341 [White spot syndrome virus]|uniref:ORF1341 n=1 Tax=White spot syndrome virus TaxID=342409 RepID=A0A2D3I630_9VIRU|nr:ORF1341 [White spot syndrome virus]